MILNKLRELALAATQKQWIAASWTIHDEDRAAQQRREPFWTLVQHEGSYEGIIAGPIGRKSLDTDYIIQPLGYAEGIGISDADANYLSATHPQTILVLLDALEIATEALNKISEGRGTGYYIDDRHMLEIRGEEALDKIKAKLAEIEG